MFPDELRVSSFPDRFPHYAWTVADFVGSRMYACSGVTCHQRFWQIDRGLLRATAVTRILVRTPNKSQHSKLTLEKKILPPFLPGFELATFRSRVRRSNQQAITAPGCLVSAFLSRTEPSSAHPPSARLSEHGLHRQRVFT